MVSKNIKVCVRTRPTAEFAQNQILIDADKNAITVCKQTAEEAPAILNNAQSNFKFNFHHVLHNASQETVYETLARDVVQDVVDGINGTIMTYGQTGSGKTFTMLGDMNNYTHRGVAPRAIAQLFGEMGLRIETQFRVVCTYMEIYNERIFDLLKSLSDDDARSDYAIVEEKGGRGVIVRGLVEVEVASEADALNLLFSGQLARTTAQHKLNRTSNRSHSIFTVVVQQQSRSGVSERIVTSKLNLVDLAGSERLKKTMEAGGGSQAAPIDETLKKESMYINQSLTYLEQCVVALSRRNAEKGHVAYRQTKLTSVLKDSLGGNCATLLYACIWGEAAHLEETVSTLRLAARMMRVVNTATAVETTDPVRLARRQDVTIRELRQELLMHDALADRSGVKYEPYTAAEKQNLQAQLQRYCAADVGRDDEVLKFESVREMKELCSQFKALLRDAEDRAQQAARAAGDGNFGSPPLRDDGFAGDATAQFAATASGHNSQSDFVGATEAGSGFSLGRAGDNARPVTQDGALRKLNSETESSDRGAMLDAFEPPKGRDTLAETLSDKSRAFEHFKRSAAGAGAAERVARAKAGRAACKVAARDSARGANAAKVSIDRLASQLADKRSVNQRRDGRDDDVVDEEEFVLLKGERDAKRAYRAAHASYVAAKFALDAAKLDVEAQQTLLIDGFDSWHAAASMGLPPAPEEYEDDDDKLDDQEHFDKMEMERIVSADPDAVAFFQAQKTRRANLTQNRTQLRQMHRNKRS
ncbi:P-loop containing nucleoside triphosphate hydrolase protein [Pelagophyceae sp. CCMP2097]|nr:P-loop containing nucleoside triphosphate hydrolase protein [Pelagophyceae sp. CCMP2097]|mmetsp:Transcript_7242/g.25349  ORF Transcript_7242/g.25349 Transcript_7242/m.25349 type:complete len:759 (-) Transcript_7242:74-2350(-)